MRIAITSDLYYPMTNGVAVFAHNLAQGLAKQGHEVMVLCPSFTGKPHRTREGRVTTVYLRSIRFPFYPDQINKVPETKAILGMNLPRLAYRYGLWITVDPYPEMKKALKRFRPEVIHNQTAEMVAIAAFRYARKYQVPMVCTGHAYPDNITSQLKVLKPIKRPLDAMLRMYMASFLKHAEYATMPTEMAIADLVPKNRKHFQVPVEKIKDALKKAKVKGRIEMVKVSDDFTLMIDYAHNAMSLESILTTLKEYHPKRLVCLFGCGGNRSKDRRYEMGEVSGRLADLTIITSDNPRFEEPQAIIDDIKIGIGKTDGKYVEICDRKEAIKYAIAHGQPGDVIVLAGKGHEDYQEIRGVKYPMDERVLIAEVLEELKEEKKEENQQQGTV